MGASSSPPGPLSNKCRSTSSQKSYDRHGIATCIPSTLLRFCTKRSAMLASSPPGMSWLSPEVSKRIVAVPTNSAGRPLRAYQDQFWNFQGPAVRSVAPKRPLPYDPATQTGRPLAPKPAAPGPTGHALGPSPTAMSPLANTQTFSPEQRRRRGRPSKKDQEDRRQRLSENRASGPPLQPAPTYGMPPQQLVPGPSEVPQSPATSAPSLAGTVVATPQGPGAQSHRQSSNSGGSSSSKTRRRVRAPNAPKDATHPQAQPPPTFGGAPEGQRHAPLPAGETQGFGQTTTGRDERRASEGSSRGQYMAGSAALEAPGGDQEGGNKSAELRNILND
jgi:hypothetical protein